MTRKAQAEVNDLFINRWSPRAFADKQVPDHLLKSVLEAARWSPSSYNEQPWHFYIARTEEDKERYLDLLIDFNRNWAKTAPVIGFITTRRRFAKNDEENDVAEFDAGAAWMSMTLQARMHGLYTHGMAGIKHDEIYDTLDIDRDEHKLLCGFTLGYKGDQSKIAEDLRREPNDRKDLAEIWTEGVQ